MSAFTDAGSCSGSGSAAFTFSHLQAPSIRKRQSLTVFDSIEQDELFLVNAQSKLSMLFNSACFFSLLFFHCSYMFYLFDGDFFYVFVHFPISFHHLTLPFLVWTYAKYIITIHSNYFFLFGVHTLSFVGSSLIFT